MPDTVDLPPQFKPVPVKCCYSHSLLFNCVHLFSWLKYGTWIVSYFLGHKIPHFLEVNIEENINYSTSILGNITSFLVENYRRFWASLFSFTLCSLCGKCDFFLYSLFCVLITWYIWGGRGYHNCNLPNRHVYLVKHKVLWVSKESFLISKTNGR
jgi:hypothetical protein